MLIFIFIPIFLSLIVPIQKKKKTRSEVVIYEDDFTVHMNRSRTHS